MIEDLKARIEAMVQGHRIVLFMKGTPAMPMCGFSAAAVEVLRAAGATDFAAYDVLSDPELRDGIKEYSSWPTIPQCYIDGKLAGGSDILRDLFERGELGRMVAGG